MAPWALITGASSGIGEATAEALAAAKFNLLLVARRKDRLLSIAQKIGEKFKVEVEITSIDISISGKVDQLGSLASRACQSW